MWFYAVNLIENIFSVSILIECRWKSLCKFFVTTIEIFTITFLDIWAWDWHFGKIINYWCVNVHPLPPKSNILILIIKLWVSVTLTFSSSTYIVLKQSINQKEMEKKLYQVQFNRHSFVKQLFSRFV